MFPIGPGKYFPDEESIEKLYKVLEDAGVDTIDTARLYGDSEEWIGKTGGFAPGGGTAETIPQYAKESVQRTGVDKLDIFYIHAPDASVPLEDQLQGINTAYKAGHFKRFGLSNFTPADVQRVYDICKEKGYVLPTVYQANYSAVARKNEEVLIPTLRKLGIAFYVPIAGGLLTKTTAQLRDRGEGAGRFAKGDNLERLYNGLYNKPSYYKALDLWEEAANEAGCSKAELAYRWVAFDSVVDAKCGDAIIFGASKHSHVAETKAKAKIDEIWEIVEDDAPVDNFHM
ncbi:NADP-dependent oxidoreductase domain-containing protein [Mycena metata]|uniref:NADP-dependent oxidoreductase domain-containing protein n=1 Tax=Mycena metata TaxID=1033252 RepID=A0AAD7H9Q1_9AGAR|nr:NADP-dependent oxidoreductase domain-containing protein [Mycena metata]